MVLVNPPDVQTLNHCSRPVDPPPEDLLPEYITVEDLGKILQKNSPEKKEDQTPPPNNTQQDYLKYLFMIARPQNGEPARPAGSFSKECLRRKLLSKSNRQPVIEIDLTEDAIDLTEDDIEETSEKGFSIAASALPLESHDSSHLTNLIEVRQPTKCGTFDLTTEDQSIQIDLVERVNEAPQIDAVESINEIPQIDVVEPINEASLIDVLEPVNEAPQSPKSVCSEPELQIDLSDHEPADPTPAVPAQDLQKPDGTHIVPERDKHAESDSAMQDLIASDLERVEIKVEYPDELVEVPDSTELTSHSRVAQFQCDTCPFETDIAVQFEVHRKVHKTVYSCNWCKYRSYSHARLNKHQLKQHKSHVDHLIYRCEKCDFSTTVQRNLLRHSFDVHQIYRSSVRKQSKVVVERLLDVEEEQCFRCTLCRKKCGSQVKLSEHLWKHAFVRVDDKQLMKCPECDLTDRSLYVLRNHYRAIHGDQPYVAGAALEGDIREPKRMKKK